MRRRYRFIDGKCVEVFNEQAAREAAKLCFSSDDMPPTLHPATGEYFTSKKKFSARTRELGYEEVGTAYENGWTPELPEKRERQVKEKRIELLREMLG